MNSETYDELIERLKKRATTEEKVDDLATIVCMMITNDLSHIYRAIKGLRWLFVAVLLAVLFSDQISMTKLFELLIKVF